MRIYKCDHCGGSNAARYNFDPDYDSEWLAADDRFHLEEVWIDLCEACRTDLTAQINAYKKIPGDADGDQ